MKKIISIVGARPQFIKLAPLSTKIRTRFNEIIIHTGQHFDKEMSDLFFEELGIPLPDYNLNVSGNSHGYQTGNMLIKIEEILLKEKPELVVVYGDTNSTLAGALAASKLNIKSIHIEAGLRSFNRLMPEEVNRILTDHCCDYLFAPTLTAMKNLEKENLSKKSFLVGDIMVDSVNHFWEKALKYSNLNFNINYYLLTLHRPYNVDDPNNLRKIINKLSLLNKNIIFPIHPRTKKIIEQNAISIPSNFIIIKPVGYLDFLKLEMNADKIITDSGGIQKEAYILNKPCITLRPETEWIETIEEGWNILLSPDQEDFIDKILIFSPNQKQKKIFGQNVSERIFNRIKKIIE